MNIFILLIFGALVGWLTSVIVKTNSQQGLLGDIILGILGSLVGGFVMGLFGEPGVTGFNLYSVLVGIVGALIAVMIGRSVARMVS